MASVSIETITPELAAAYLESAAPNRKRKMQKVALFTRLMNERKWHLGWDAVAFNSNGGLVNGQNRLAAQVASRTTHQFIVARGIDNFRDGDTVQTRTASQSLAIHYAETGREIKAVGRVSSLATAVRRICLSTDKSGGWSPKHAWRPMFSREELDPYIVPELAWVIDATTTREAIRSSDACAMLAVIRACNSELAEKLASGLFRGIMLDENSPMRRARNSIMDPRERNGSRSTGDPSQRRLSGWERTVGDVMLVAWAAEQELSGVSSRKRAKPGSGDVNAWRYRLRLLRPHLFA